MNDIICDADPSAEVKFYARCAEILNLPFKEIPRHSRLTRWNNRHPGNGRFEGFGTIRAFNPHLIHLAFHSPIRQSRIFSSAEEAYAYLEKIISQRPRLTIRD